MGSRDMIERVVLGLGVGGLRRGVWGQGRRVGSGSVWDLSAVFRGLAALQWVN